MKKITSTELKQNTREILNEIQAGTGPTIVYTYNEPRVVILSYKEWLKNVKKKGVKSVSMKKNLSPYHKKVLSLTIKGPKIDSAKIIRKMRDAE